MGSGAVVKSIGAYTSRWRHMIRHDCRWVVLVTVETALTHLHGRDGAHGKLHSQIQLLCGGTMPV
jgi:hypothetical protein